jgi:putative holliday junction resolvase
MASFTRVAARAAHAAASSKAMRILALDYGRRNIGVAVSDELGVTAQPLAALERKNRREDLRRLRQVMKKNQADLIIVGLPLHLSGKHGEMAGEAERFAARVQKELGLPVVMRDERLTSWQAEEMAKESKSAKGAVLDSLAAAILLREYLDEERAREKSDRPIHT